jgi:hypothetical protein
VLRAVLDVSKSKTARVPRRTVGGGEVRLTASLFVTIGTPSYCVEPTLSASQNPHTHIGGRCGAPGLCRARVKGRTPTDTSAIATAVTDDLCCGGTRDVFECHWFRFHASLSRDDRGRNSPPVVPLASRQKPRRSHGPLWLCPWYFTWCVPINERYRPNLSFCFTRS